MKLETSTRAVCRPPREVAGLYSPSFTGKSQQQLSRRPKGPPLQTYDSYAERRQLHIVGAI
eukprot:4308998-Pyramimonas_sp.AAC.1